MVFKKSIFIAFVILVLDQVTKIWAVDMVIGRGVIPYTEFFNLVLVYNTGVTFGMFEDGAGLGKWLLIGLSVLIVGYLLWLWRGSGKLLEQCLLMAVIGGALGNVIDRVRVGAVIDFLDFHFKGYHWPAFNVADSAIVCSIILYVLLQFRKSAD